MSTAITLGSGPKDSAFFDSVEGFSELCNTNNLGNCARNFANKPWETPNLTTLACTSHPINRVYSVVTSAPLMVPLFKVTKSLFRTAHVISARVLNCTVGIKSWFVATSCQIEPQAAQHCSKTKPLTYGISIETELLLT